MYFGIFAQSDSFTYGIAKRAKYRQTCAPKTLSKVRQIFFLRQYRLRVFSEDVPTDRKSPTLIIHGHTQNFQTVPDKSSWEGCTT